MTIKEICEKYELTQATLAYTSRSCEALRHSISDGAGLVRRETDASRLCGAYDR